MSNENLFPLLPLRDVVVFPHMMVPLFVGREKSITALNEVMKTNKKIVLVTQKNSEVDDPGKNDIFIYGCECSILQLLKLPDGTVKVLVEGIKRVRVRYDKTYKYKRGENMFGNFETVALDIWKSILNPVSEYMLSTGDIKDVKLENEVEYYQNRSDEEINRHKEIGLKIREDYFEPVTKEGVRNFLMLDLP
mgnify:CR=1 FL=1